jgi:hypothetical protein
MLPAMENEEILDIFKEGSDAYLYGEMELDDCAQLICAEINEILEKSQEM